MGKFTDTFGAAGQAEVKADIISKPSGKSKVVCPHCDTADQLTRVMGTDILLCYACKKEVKIDV